MGRPVDPSPEYASLLRSSIMRATIGARDRGSNADPFAHRADDYATANAERPDARTAERARLLDPLPLDDLGRVVDLQAASGYVGQGLIERSGRRLRVASVEPSRELVRRLPRHLGPVHAPLHALPFATRSVDAVVCLAGTHHSPRLAPIVDEAFRVLRPGGWISMAEAETESGPARFLNGFVDRWNDDGHDGRFVAPGDMADALSATGFEDVSESGVDVPWRFGDHAALVDFCHTLFGVRRASARQVADALGTVVGIESDADGVTLRWHLRYALGRVPASG